MQRLGPVALRILRRRRPASASHFPTPESGEAPPTPVTSGRRSRALSRKRGPVASSWRTSRGTSIWEPPPCSATFAQWVTASKRACSRRSKPARRRIGDGSSLWPTPTGSLYCNRLEIEFTAEGLRFRNDPTQSGQQVALGKVARTWTLIYLIACAVGARRFGRFHFPYTRRLHIALMPGPRSSTGDLTFNPKFSEWLMGWPIGWTDPLRPVTGWRAWRRRMRGELSRLPMPPDDGW